MITKQDFIAVLRDVLTVIPQYDTAQFSPDYRCAIERAKRTLEQCEEAPKKKAAGKDIECQPLDNGEYLWKCKDGREFKATFAHDQKYYNSIVSRHGKQPGTNNYDIGFGKGPIMMFLNQ